jgi:hypothetical protein
VSEGDDVAALLSASWRVTRRLVLKKNGVPEFHFRQYLFASQARVLLRLRRPVDVAERGLHFVQVGRSRPLVPGGLELALGGDVGRPVGQAPHAPAPVRCWLGLAAAAAGAYCLMLAGCCAVTTRACGACTAAQGFWKLLSEKEAAGVVRPLFKEAWAFTACLALILTTTGFVYRPESVSQVG